jgi:hypothetical protein
MTKDEHQIPKILVEILVKDKDKVKDKDQHRNKCSANGGMELWSYGYMGAHSRSSEGCKM